MSNDTNNGPGAAHEPEQPAAAPEPHATQAGPGAGAPMSDAAGEVVLAKLMAENAELKDRLLRAHAEMDNIRKRTEREKVDAQKYALTKFARDLVNVGDNFERAIKAVPAEAAEQSEVLRSFLDGMTMTERELLKTFETHGVKRIDPKGEPFNPHMHQAVMEAPDPTVPAGTVTQVFQCGYMIEDRVLRAAMVVVATGGPKMAPANGNGQAAPPQQPSGPDAEDGPAA
ncbi:MAG: nucleotide exchange factor GrpE [Hyphomicrobiaceae bacterium]